MTPYAIAGIQMYLKNASNLEAMKTHIEITMHHYPWVNMVLFSELACFGPLLHHDVIQPSPYNVHRWTDRARIEATHGE